MRRNEGGGRVARLWLSALGFAAPAITLAVVNMSLLFGIAASGNGPFPTVGSLLDVMADFALPALPGAIVSWWLLVVIPRRSDAVVGGCAGLLTVILAVLGVCVVGIVFGGLLARPSVPLTLWQSIEGALTFWLLGVVYLCAHPFGWGGVRSGGTALLAAGR